MFGMFLNGCATSTSGVLSIALLNLMIPVSISILVYLVLENLPTLQSWQKRLLLLAVLCALAMLAARGLGQGSRLAPAAPG